MGSHAGAPARVLLELLADCGPLRDRPRHAAGEESAPSGRVLPHWPIWVDLPHSRAREGELRHPPRLGGGVRMELPRSYRAGRRSFVRIAHRPVLRRRRRLCAPWARGRPGAETICLTDRVLLQHPGFASGRTRLRSGELLGNSPAGVVRDRHRPACDLSAVPARGPRSGRPGLCAPAGSRCDDWSGRLGTEWRGRALLVPLLRDRGVANRWRSIRSVRRRRQQGQPPTGARPLRGRSTRPGSRRPPAPVRHAVPL